MSNVEKTKNNEYLSFIESKKTAIKDSGFEVSEKELTEKYPLYDFQAFAVHIALKKGKYALFEECGLGKTIQQLSWANEVAKHTKKPVIVLCPLAVLQQTIAEGNKFGIEVERFSFIELRNIVYVLNYDQLENIEDCGCFGGVVLDESSILKNYTGATKMLILDRFKHTPYKLACTATPSPNDHLELGNHSDFLDVMPSNEMIARFFINDTMHFGGYRLKGHGESDFWEWVASWAMCIANPSDIGFKETGAKYVLPEMKVNEVSVTVDETDFENSKLFKVNNVSATTFNKELKLSANDRLIKVAEIANSTNEQYVIWINQNEEGEVLRKLIPDAIEVTGSDSVEKKEKYLLGFARNEFRVLITKKKIAQFGLNWQNCKNMIFANPDFTFEGTYQAIRRIYRFGQKNEVNVFIVTTNTLTNVMKTLKEKELQFREMQSKMSEAIGKVYFQETEKLSLKTTFTHKIEKGTNWEMHNGDCVEVLKTFADCSIDFSIFSPPFAGLYIYSNSVFDMGNCDNDDAFFVQFGFLVKELHRVMRGGRLVAVHSKNLVNYMNSNGKSGQRDFRGAIIKAFEKEGFSYHSEVTIWKDPVIEMQRTKAHGLLYKQLRKDSSFTRNGMAEYLTIFRKWENAETNEPINWKTKENYPLSKWQEVASPVWNTEMTKDDLLEIILQQSELIDKIKFDVSDVKANSVWNDIRQTNVLNIKEARANKDEKHICPLQLDVIQKAVELWTNPNEVVFSPFSGIGSEGYESLKLGRKFKGIELKPEYFEKACKNLKEVNILNSQIKFF